MTSTYNNNSYPVYKAGKLLSSEQLNNSFKYTNHQLDITNLYAHGIGVLEGIELKRSRTRRGYKLYISKGVAITPNGKILFSDHIDDEINKPIPILSTQSSLNISYEKIKRIRRHKTLTAKDLKYMDRIPYGTDTHLVFKSEEGDNYILALHIDNKTTTTSKNCNNEEEYESVVLTPVLILESLLRNRVEASGYHSPFRKLVLPKPLQGAKNVKDICKNLNSSYSKNTEQLVLFVKNLFKQELAISLLGTHKTNSVASAINKFESLSAQVQKDTNDFNKKITNWLFIMHLKNIQKAINEFIDVYNEIVALNYYDNTPVAGYENFILMGSLNPNQSKLMRDVYIQKHKIAHKQRILRQLFDRLMYLFKTSYQNMNVQNTTKLIPTTVETSKLGQQTVPYQYNIDLQDVWCADKEVCNAHTHVLTSSGFQETDLYYDYTNSSYLLEIGHVKKKTSVAPINDVNAIEQTLRTIIKAYDLPLKVNIIQLMDSPFTFFSETPNLDVIEIDQGIKDFVGRFHKNTVFFMHEDIQDSVKNDFRIVSLRSSKGELIKRLDKYLAKAHTSFSEYEPDKKHEIIMSSLGHISSFTKETPHLKQNKKLLKDAAKSIVKQAHELTPGQCAELIDSVKNIKIHKVATVFKDLNKEIYQIKGGRFSKRVSMKPNYQDSILEKNLVKKRGRGGFSGTKVKGYITETQNLYTLLALKLELDNKQVQYLINTLGDTQLTEDKAMRIKELLTKDNNRLDKRDREELLGILSNVDIDIREAILNDNIDILDEPEDKEVFFPSVKVTNIHIDRAQITNVFNKNDTINLLAYNNIFLFPIKV